MLLCRLTCLRLGSNAYLSSFQTGVGELTMMLSTELKEPSDRVEASSDVFREELTRSSDALRDPLEARIALPCMPPGICAAARAASLSLTASLRAAA